jgi:hypothetical protein
VTELRSVLQALAIIPRESIVTDLCVRYATGNKRFNYAAFLSDLDSKTPPPAIDDSVLREFGKFFSSRNITLNEWMRETDRYHLGRVTEGAFLNAVGTTALTREIARAYMRRPHNDVYYFELARDLARVGR